MSKFRTMYDPHDRQVSNSGDREKPIYRAQLDEHGHLELIEDGKESVYDYIQSHRDSVDLHKILDRFQQGDVAALSRVQGVYADLTSMPKSYAEMLNAVIAGEQYFAGLPLEVRARFGHSFQQWMVSMDQPDFAEKMGWQQPAHEQPVAGSPAADPSTAPADTPAGA